MGGDGVVSAIDRQLIEILSGNELCKPLAIFVVEFKLL